MIDGAEDLIVSLCANAVSVLELENMVHDVYGLGLSESTFFQITDRVAGDVIAWHKRLLNKVYLII